MHNSNNRRMRKWRRNISGNNILEPTKLMTDTKSNIHEAQKTPS